MSVIYGMQVIKFGTTHTSVDRTKPYSDTEVSTIRLKGIEMICGVHEHMQVNFATENE